MTEQRRTDRRVRPRGVWTGTALAMLGALALGVAVAIGSWVWAGTGLALLLAGTAVGWVSGGYYNVHVGAEPEMGGVVRGETRSGVAPGDEVESPEAHRRAHEIEVEVRRRLEAAERASRPALGRLAAIVVLLVALFLVASQWELYPRGEEPQANATRSLGVAIVIAAAALRVLTGPGRHPVAAAATFAAGVVLVVFGAVADHATTATAAAEIVSGALVCLCALAFAAPRG